ncbi:helicase C-terminal domain-containing protein [Streptomyces scopuliridis]|uniref:Helicase C-terminal domain-containing protein n=1 Tax=Streptomyces scopuliridis TaxID=452529 RepID=A0ACD4ZN83_9ACTN|nr:helicase C-terminal domain-containing protein [Streptomyces scopuliridis]WSB99453.1 helicase C-terminal domain-containing protein [Streptomyces scopuliridis]WSC06847.1 helicase C-terminal domain-containing protein [Streptomyces scopuliridis]
MPEGTGGTPPRTLAEALRTQGDGSLVALLRARPDLLSPVPSDLSQLATRAGTRASVVRALERLDRFTLQTAEALAVATEPAPYDTLRALLTGDEGDPEIEAVLPRAVETLRDRALIWGADDRLRLVRTARELLAPSPTHPSPTGLGPTVAEATAGMSPGRLQEILTAAGLPSTHDPVSAVAALTGLFTDRTRMAALLDTAPVEALSVLDRLVWGPPYGEVTSSPTPPVQWLRDRGLLLPATTRTVVLPREAALHLRAGRAHRTPEPVAPTVAPRASDASTGARPQVVDNTAAGQAYTALATIEELAKDWNEGGPNVLRAGGLSVRDLKRTATALDVTEPVAAFWVELAYTAGLLAADGETDERYAPTPAYDDWQELPAPERWARLATAWLTATRTAGLVGGQDSKGRTLAALGPDLDRGAAPEVRRRILDLLATLPEGTAPDPESLLARLRWERPLRGASGTGRHDDLRARLAAWTLNEAEMLGITGRGALASHARALLAPDATDGEPAATADGARTLAELTATGLRAARALAPLLPEPLDHVLLQADLTAVAPGPLLRPLAELLAIAAEVESKGGATVYRFTPGSVRRALDAGQSASDLHDFLRNHSRTPVPQPLAYLIDDVARKHGHLRVGAASAYVRCDDEAVLDEILADKRSQGLRLRRLAPTVLAAHADAVTLLDGLRVMGFAPAAESAEGDVMITRAHAHRTPPRTAPAPVPDGPATPDTTLLSAAVKAIRAGDLAATVVHKPVPEPSGSGSAALASAAAASRNGALPRTTSAETLATVQAAAMTGSAVWIGYVNADGAASQRVIAPVRVEGGYVTGYDHTADEVRTYPLHRITGVAELADDPA